MRRSRPYGLFAPGSCASAYPACAGEPVYTTDSPCSNQVSPQACGPSSSSCTPPARSLAHLLAFPFFSYSRESRNEMYIQGSIPHFHSYIPTWCFHPHGSQEFSKRTPDSRGGAWFQLLGGTGSHKEVLRPDLPKSLGESKFLNQKRHLATLSLGGLLD